MALVPQINCIDAYLAGDDVIDFMDPSVTELSDALLEANGEGTGSIKACYEFVRDQIAHSADIK